MKLPNFVKSFCRITLKNKRTTRLFDRYMSDFYDRLMGRSPPQKLWFDDGYVEDYTIIFPLLKRYNIVGTLAIVTGRVGKRGFLNVDQLKIMMNEGWKIASHSVTHRNFKRLSLEEVDSELRRSKEWIQNNLGVTPIMFVPPYGLKGITEAQKQQILQYYPFICMETQHFHSNNFRLDWSRDLADFSETDVDWNSELRQGVAEYERATLRKFLENIELHSGFWRAELHTLNLPNPPKMPEGYTLKSVIANDVSDKHKMAWQRLNEKKEWSVPGDALVFFILFDGNLVATEYALARNGIGTLHSAIVDDHHRKKGFYRLMSLSGIQYLIQQGITVFELHTNIGILWHFWHSLGFRKVYRISLHAQSQSEVKGKQK
jgi:peptidoglycan/xylan/chitin deacetylase (PgdA/CDA1 family)